MTRRNLIIIGERINPGFKSSKSFIDNSDFEGIQALAINQAAEGKLVNFPTDASVHLLVSNFV